MGKEWINSEGKCMDRNWKGKCALRIEFKTYVENIGTARKEGGGN